MTQITSSAIWNGPSPDGYVSMLNRTNTAERMSQRTHEKLLRIFAARLPLLTALCTEQGGTISFLAKHAVTLHGGMQEKYPDSQKMLARRNWCEVLPFAEEEGAAVDPRSHNALASSQPRSGRCSITLHCLQRVAQGACLRVVCSSHLRSLLHAAQVFVLRVEDPDKQEAPPETFSTIVPTFTQHTAGVHAVCLFPTSRCMPTCVL